MPIDEQRGRIRQSVMAWCFNPMNALELARHGRRIGLVAIEGLDVALYPKIRELGLDVSLVSSHGFKLGMCNPMQHQHCVDILRERIDLAADAGYKRVITFTGMLPEGMARDEAFQHCVDGFKKIVGHAEKKNVTLCLEHLNSRDDTHPMKGHPGYQGDHVDYCMDIIKQVGSPRFGLLFDIYHVQIMDGDIIRRIRQCGEAINHVHTAGNPGRGELDAAQEINYPPCMKALVEIGYKGYVGQEFIPTRDPLAGLTEAVKLCDV